MKKLLLFQALLIVLVSCQKDDEMLGTQDQTDNSRISISIQNTSVNQTLVVQLTDQGETVIGPNNSVTYNNVDRRFFNILSAYSNYDVDVPLYSVTNPNGSTTYYPGGMYPSPGSEHVPDDMVRTFEFSSSIDSIPTPDLLILAVETRTADGSEIFEPRGDEYGIDCITFIIQ
jgi:hypothetical protein